MAAQRRGPGSSGRPSDGQHFLRSARLAAELVDHSGVGSDDLVIEIGGGAGRLTAPLAARAGRVLVVERDRALVDLLRDRTANMPNVEVVEANALHAALPQEPFRVFGNLPFSFGTRILRRLLDEPASDLQRLDALLVATISRGFAAPTTPVSVTFRRRIAPSAWKRLVADRGLPRDARPADLDVLDWVALFRTLSQAPRTERGSTT